MPTPKRTRGFTPHGARWRAFVTLSREDATAIEQEAKLNDEPVTATLRRAVRFYIYTTQDPQP